MNHNVRIPPLAPDDRSTRQRDLLTDTFGDDAPHLFSTVVRNPDLYEAWFPFCMKLLRRSAFPRRQRELIILRTAAHCGAEYELHHHQRIGLRAGIADAEMAALLSDADYPWSAQDQELLRAVDQLLTEHQIDIDTWASLRTTWDEEQLVELPMLVGHYALLAMLLNTLQVPLDEESNR